MPSDQIKLQRFFEMPDFKEKIKKETRLFLPLNEKWYKLYHEGEKCWELRGVNDIFNFKTIREGRTVELRRGYKSDPLWGIITECMAVNSFDEIPSTIFDKTIPNPVRNDPEVKSFLKQYSEKYNKFILFRIKIVEGGQACKNIPIE